MSDNYTDFKINKSLTEDVFNNQIKTTDVNILLNRVKLEKKNTFKKNMLFSIFLVGLISSISIFFII